MRFLFIICFLAIATAAQAVGPSDMQCDVAKRQRSDFKDVARFLQAFEISEKKVQTESDRRPKTAKVHSKKK